MRTLVRAVQVAVLGFVAAGGAPGVIAAYAQEPVSAGDGPRFLIAMAGRSAPVEAEVAAVPLLRRRVSLGLENATLAEALKAMKRVAGIDFVYSPGVLNATQRVTLRAENMTVAAVLSDLLVDARVDVLLSDAKYVTLVPRRPREVAQFGSVAGAVTDAKTGHGLAGVDVLLDGTRWHAVTGENGRYRLADVTPGGYTLLARRIGYGQERRAVAVSEGQEATVDVALQPAPTKFDEVVVTGTVVPTEVKALPTPVTVVSADEILAQHATNINQVLRQAVPSAVAWDFGVDPEQTSLSVRGASTLNPGGGSMKIYVDGIESSGRTFAAIDPNSIERVEVIRGPQAATIYGSDAIGGVMQIFTKRGDGRLARPEVALSAAAGALQSAYETTDRQEYTGRVSGGSPSGSYSVGGSFARHGNWIPEGNLSVLSGFGAVHFTQGPLTLDLSARHLLTQTPEGAEPSLGRAFPALFGKPFYNSYDFHNVTYGGNLTYAATSRWRHSLTVGVDGSPTEAHQTQGRRLQSPNDTLLFIYYQHPRKISVGYSTSLALPIATGLSATVTAGVDHYSLTQDGFSTSGAYNTTGYIRTDPNQPPVASISSVTNTGVFGQAVLAVRDQLFITGGLRAERNSNFGAALGTPLSPRVGASYARQIGGATVKLRASYGEAISPPTPGERDAVNSGNGSLQLANPNLGPERQKGWDAGVDLAAGARGSIGVTYYNQVARDLINYVNLPSPPGEFLSQFQNIGRVKNTGVEVEGTLSLGIAQLRAQYGYSKSQAQELGASYTGDLRVGEQLILVPKHTAGGSITVTPSAGTSVTGGVTYVGSWRYYDNYAFLACFGGTGPCQPAFRDYLIQYPSLFKVNLSVTQRLARAVSGFLTVDNATNSHRFEFGNSAAVLGRTSMAGLRVQL